MSVAHSPLAEMDSVHVRQKALGEMDSVHVRQKALGEAYRNRWNPITNRHEIVDEICARLTAGEPMAQICRDEHIPVPSVLWEWEQADAAIADAISRAREHGHDAIAMDALDIADNLSGDVQRDKLRFDARMRLLGKWNPKRYGEATQLRHADANGDKLDTAPLIGELLTMLGNSQDAQPAINITPRVIEAPQPAAAAGYKPRAKRLTPPPAVDDLV